MRVQTKHKERTRLQPVARDEDIDGSLQSAYRLPYDLAGRGREGRLRMSAVQLSKPQRRNRFAHLGNHAAIVRNDTDFTPEPLSQHIPFYDRLSQDHRTPGNTPRTPRHPASYSWQCRIMPSPSQSAATGPSQSRPPCTAPDGPLCSPWQLTICQVRVYLFDVYPPHLSLSLSLASQPHRRWHPLFVPFAVLIA